MTLNTPSRQASTREESPSDVSRNTMGDNNPPPHHNPSPTSLSSHRNDSEGSENDHERPVREKLKKASLGALQSHHGDPSVSTEAAELRRTSVDSPMPPAVTDLGDPTAVEHGTKPPTSQPGPPSALAAADSRAAVPEDTMPSGSTDDGNSNSRPMGMHLAQKSEDVALSDITSHEAPAGDHPAAGVVSDSPDLLRADSNASHARRASDLAESADESMEDARARIKSPRKKRSRDQFDEDLENDRSVQAALEEQRKEVEAAKEDTIAPSSRTLRDEPEKKRHRETSQEAAANRLKGDTKIPPASGFANSSDVSPFGTLASAKPAVSETRSSSNASSSPQPQTSTSAFASSGFSALAGSSTSPFGNLGPSSTGAAQPAMSSFGAGATGGSGFGGFGTGAAAKSTAGFGSTTAAPSAFGTGTSGFAKLSGGFGPTAGGLKGFASSGGQGIIGLSEKPVKAFGAPEEDDDEDDEGESDEEAEEGDDDNDRESVATKDDKRFRPRELETGEEGEETRFSERVKLYYFHTGDNPKENAWKSRGAGVLKVNFSAAQTASTVDEPDDEDVESASAESGPASSKQGPTARLIMRSEGVYRVILNAPIFKGMKVGDHEGKMPRDSKLKFTALEDGKPVIMQFAVSSSILVSDVRTEARTESESVEADLLWVIATKSCRGRESLALHHGRTRGIMKQIPFNVSIYGQKRRRDDICLHLIRVRWRYERRMRPFS
ncbi:MAG: hypothetical protein M1817_006243 [Caeruleum heppii]|nr:MAG: hypothetical protein M1817_006243 [Caeruleum heppii]